MSRTRRPVTRGMSGWYFSETGLGLRTGQYWTIGTSFPPMVATVSSMVKDPLFMFSTLAFFIPMGTMILWTMGPSCTVPITSPSETTSPVLAVGTKSHFLL